MQGTSTEPTRLVPHPPENGQLAPLHSTAEAMVASPLQAIPAEDRLGIDANWKDLACVTPEVWASIVRKNTPPYLFRHGNPLVRLTCNDQGAPVLGRLDFHQMRHEVARAVYFYRTDPTSGARRGVTPPSEIVHDMLAAAC